MFLRQKIPHVPLKSVAAHKRELIPEREISEFEKLVPLLRYNSELCLLHFYHLGGGAFQILCGMGLG